MSGKLKRLISYCEAEYRTLTAAIDACVTEGDYGTAQRLAKGMRRVGRKLQILLNLQDPLHGEKQYAIRCIKGLEELSASESGRVLDHYRDWIGAERQKLAALEARATQQTNAPPATALHQALMKLFEAQIDSFTLVLSESERLCLIFKPLRRTLLITLPAVRRHRAAYTLGKRHIRHLQALGFRLDDRQDNLLLWLPFGEKAKINQVKIILAQIAFDCFYFEELQGKSSIRYDEPEP
ncbi:hypothetical protein ACVWYF_000041 [Hymenobacter sp. UYAg731]